MAKVPGTRPFFARGRCSWCDRASFRPTLPNVHWTARNTRLKLSLMISVIVIDDHPIALQGCRRLLEDAGIGPIYCATDLETAYQLFLSGRPEVAIIDLTFPGDGLGGLEFIRRIKAFAKQTHVIVFSMHDDPAIVAQALEAGASSYLRKDAHSEELVKAVRRIY
jgi:two-component system, NarL family, invasion response regulator UvrY